MGVLIPSENWMADAMRGAVLPPISVALDLQDAEQAAMEKNGGFGFWHDPEMYNRQFTAPRMGPMTEQEAIEYLCMKDLPRGCWTRVHNRPMFRIVHKNMIPSDRRLRDAWSLQ